MKKIAVILFLICASLYAGEPVVVVNTSDPNKWYTEFQFKLETAGETLATAKKTAEMLVYQEQALQSLSDFDLENFAEFMTLQSKSTTALNSAMTNYRTSSLLMQYAGQDRPHNEDLYYEAKSAARDSQDGSSFGQHLENLSNLEWKSGNLLADLDNYQKKTERRRELMKQVHHSGGEVSQLQTMSELLSIVADQNEDSMRLMRTYDVNEGNKKKLELQKQEYERTQAQIQKEQAGAVPSNFGQTLMGTKPVDIHDHVRQQRLDYERKDGNGYGF